MTWPPRWAPRVLRTRILGVVAITLLAGTATALTGGLAFVGLMVPHIVRQLVGADHRRVLPCSVLLGAIVLLAADLVARLALAPAELPLGIVTAGIGAPFFVWLLAGGRVGRGRR